MKPKYRRIAKTIPAIITLVMASAAVSSAAIVTDDGSGDYTITSVVDADNSGPNTVFAGGGTSANPFVDVLTGAVITGDAIETRVIEISDDNYTVNNSGSIAATAGKDGIVVVAGENTVINNLSGGIISSETGDAIDFQVDGGTVNNFGIIEGGSDNFWDHGIQADDDFTLVNSGTIMTTLDGGNAVDVEDDADITNSGLIDGADNGIDAGNGLILSNLSGGIIQGGEYGVDAGDDLILTNDGIIEGFDEDGVSAGFNASITNTGEIYGDESGIQADDALALTNDGIIEGFEDDGVNAYDNAEITNTGSITGNDYGIYANDDLDLTNSGTITGTFDDGVYAYDDANINNSGTISGGNDGIEVNDDATIINSGTITTDEDYGIYAGDDLYLENLAGGVIFGFDEGVDAGDDAEILNAGSIEGADYGIYVLDDAVITNSGTVTATDGDAIFAEDDAEITNSGSITGAFNGIFAEDFAEITNSGTITGTAENGIRVGEDSVVNNSGTIIGNTGIDAFAFGDFELNNSGTISTNIADLAGEAIDGALGDDTINLNAGSVINGDIVLKTGDDDIVMTADALGSSIVNGNINGGFGDDTLTFVGGRTSPTSTENIVHGDVTFMQDIFKEGAGVAMIGDIDDVDGLGDPLYFVQTDRITINDGGLYINADIDGAIEDQTTIIADGAALGGTGTWDANIFVTNGGFSAGSIPINLDINPENAVGLVTVNGNVDHDAGTFIRFDVIPGTTIINGVNSDLIVQTGVDSFYDVDGANVRISPTDNDVPISEGTYTVVTSEGDITGTPGPLGVQFNANVNAEDDGFIGTLTGFTGQNVTNALLVTDFSTLAIVPNLGGGEDIILTIARDFDTLDGLSGNSLSFASALDESLDEAELQDFIAALDYSTLEDAIAIFEDVTTIDSFAIASAIVSSNYHTHRVVQDHLAMTRSSGGSVIETPATTDAKGGMIPAQYSSGGLSRGNVWGSFSYDWKDSSGFANDIDGEEASFIAGFDYRVMPNLLLGILVEGSTADYDYNGGGSDVDTLRGAIYGTYGEATGFYADFLFGLGDHEFSSERSGLLGNIDTDTDASSLQAMLTVGYAMQHNCIKHGPFLGVEHTNVEVDGYSQGGFVPFGVDDYDVDSTRLLVGYRAEADYGRFMPYLSVAYAHEFEDDGFSTTGVLPGGATFGINGGGLDSAFLISVGTGIGFTESLSMNIGYHGEISTGDGIDSHGGTIGLNYAF